MATTSRSRSLHRAGGTGSSSSSHTSSRKSSVGRQGGARGRFDPNLMMSSNTGDGDSARERPSEMGPRRKSADEFKTFEKAARRNKSSDRLHRGESSTSLAGKRSKSSTHLATAQGDPSNKRRDSNKHKAREVESEDGWTSASVAGTPNASHEASPSASPVDEGLLLGFKKRTQLQQQPQNGHSESLHRQRPEPARAASLYGSETPKVNATQLADEPEPLQPDSRDANQSKSSINRAAQSVREDALGATSTDLPIPEAPPLYQSTSGPARPAHLQREDTSRTLTNDDASDDAQRRPEPAGSPRLRTPDQSGSHLQDSPSALDRRVANLRLDIDGARSAAGLDDEGGVEEATSSSASQASPRRSVRRTENASLSTNARGGSTAATSARPSDHHRALSNASNRTLRSSARMTSSPASLHSRTSTLSNLPLLFPRENHGIVPPKLDTHNALAGALGSRHEDRGDAVGPSRGFGGALTRSGGGLPTSASEPVGLDEMFPDGLSRMNGTVHSLARRKGSMSSMTESGITLSSPSPSVGHIAPTTASRGAGDYNSVRRSAAHHSFASLHETGSNESSGVLSPERRRTTSTQSLTAADAAKLAAKLRMARDTIDEQSAASALRGASASGFLSGQRQNSNPRLEKYNKPVISNFVKDASASEGPLAVPVTNKSVFSPHFSRPHESRQKGVAPKPMYRYVMHNGLGGPPIEKSELSDALLGPSLDMDDFESSWAPALANAAGLGSRSMRHPSRIVEPEFGIGPQDTGTSVSGPNSTPLHLIHGLTTTSPDAFPLDPTDVPALQEGGDLFDPANATSPHGAVKFVDPALIRAIAMTSQAISTHRAHVVTRRYADPMRESLERMARSSGKWGPIPQAPLNTPTSPALSLSAGRWGGRKTAPTSPGVRAGVVTGMGGGGGMPERPGFARRQTSDASSSSLYRPHQAGTAQQAGLLHSHLAGQLYHLVDAAEHPVRSLKRVWSGGLTRGGLAALTSTREEPN